MNRIQYNRPNTEYPPTTDDIENIQHYITILDTEVHDENINHYLELEQYNQWLLHESSRLSRDGYVREANALIDLSGIIVQSIDH